MVSKFKSYMSNMMLWYSTLKSLTLSVNAPLVGTGTNIGFGIEASWMRVVPWTFHPGGHRWKLIIRAPSLARRIQLNLSSFECQQSSLALSVSLSLAELLGSSISQACSWCSMQICHHHKVQDEALLHFTRCSVMQCRRISAADPLLVIIIDRKKPGDQGPGISEELLLIAQIRADTFWEQIRERARSIDRMCADLFAFL